MSSKPVKPPKPISSSQNQVSSNSPLYANATSDSRKTHLPSPLSTNNSSEQYNKIPPVKSQIDQKNAINASPIYSEVNTVSAHSQSPLAAKNKPNASINNYENNKDSSSHVTSKPPSKIESSTRIKHEEPIKSNEEIQEPSSTNPFNDEPIASRTKKETTPNQKTPIAWDHGKSPNPDLYHKIHFNNEWMVLAIICHTLQFALLLSVGRSSLSNPALVVLIIFIIAVVLVLLACRAVTSKHPSLRWWSYADIKSPEDETDTVPDSVLYMLCVAIMIEGAAFALYPTAAGGRNFEELDAGGFHSYQTMSQILSFSAITLLAMQAVLRPANRLDPLRTVLEVESTQICWDALDGATLYLLLTDQDHPISARTDVAARILLCFWYLSIGVRVSLLYLAHLSPRSPAIAFLLPPPLLRSQEPTVDRTLSSINLRSCITIAMAFAQFYAGGLRLALWQDNNLSLLQQEMFFKNVLFFLPLFNSVYMFSVTKQRMWNTRELIDFPVCSGYNLSLRKPSRQFQLEFLRVAFVVTYLVTGAMFSSFLTHVTNESTMWVNNVGSDILCCIAFLFLCWKIHDSKAFILFPLQRAGMLGALLVVNLYAARVPSLYNHYSDMSTNAQDTWTYSNAMLIVLVSILPISLYALFWSVANMLYHAEFTSCPEQYHAIHDPSIILVSTQTMTDGALDIVSAVAFLSLAENDLPSSVNGAIILFAFLEVVNACQSFVLQVLLSGGHNDTPAHLIRWRGTMKLWRSVIDFGAFVLRLCLWFKYNAIAGNVFLVKNLYGLIQAALLVERGAGVKNYKDDTLFINFVRPQDWYGMTKEQWRAATRDTLFDQARAGRVV